jgi:hypothetical protein
MAIAFPLKSVSRRICGKSWVVVLAVIGGSFLVHLHFAIDYEVGLSTL